MASSAQHRLAAILIGDVAGYSRLMADDEDATVSTIASCREQIAIALNAHRGRLVDFTGDNFLADFASALDGIRCALEIQRRLAGRNAGLPAERRMQFRIGLHLGDVRIEGAKIYGDGVNIAARLESLAEPGGICVSAAVRDLLPANLDLSYRYLGEQHVKNIPQPVRAYRVSVGARDTPTPRMGGSRRWKLVAPLLGFLALSAALFWKATDSSPPTLSRGPSIAVLPFVNVGGNPEEDYFSDGLTEDLIVGLSRFQDLIVVARHSTHRYKGGAVDVREVGRALGVRYVLEGSVRRFRDRLRATAKLTQVSNGRQLWGETYDRDLTAADIFSLQDELVDKVVGAITGTYGPLSRAGLAEVRRKSTDNLYAYDCVLRTYEYLQVHTAANHLAARDCLEKAVALDPKYADAWAWLAYTYAEEYRHQWNLRPEVYDSLERALEVANQALTLEETNQVAHGVLALTYFGRRAYDLFDASASRAISINPNNSLWLGILGTYYVQLGRWEEGLPLVKRALELNPYPPVWLYTASFLDHYRRGRYETALAEAQKMTTEDFYRTHIFLAATYGQLGRRKEAQRAVAKARSLRPDLPAGLRKDLREHYGYTDEITEHLIDGLRKAGIEDLPP